MSNQTRSINTTIMIIQGTIDSPPLIGRKTLEELGMLIIDATGQLKTPNKEVKAISGRSQETSNNHTELNKMIDRHKKRFQGIGKAMRDREEIKIKVPTKENATPIAQKPRRVPYLLTDPLKNQLEEFVSQHEAIMWCSPLIVQPKPKNPNTIRACLNLRLVNKCMLRTRQVQAPITEDFIT